MTLIESLTNKGVLPAQLVERIRASENGKLAGQLSELAYKVFQSGDYVLIHGTEDEVKKILYAAGAALEGFAMREELERLSAG